MVYTQDERVEMILIYGATNRNSVECANAFNAAHPDKHVSPVYIRNLLSKFQTTGSIQNKKREPRLANEAQQVAVLGHVNLEPTKSIRQLSAVSGISRSSVHRILKHHKFYPYKPHLLQELNEDDFDRRQEFCENLEARLNNNLIDVKNICFTDESCFFFKWCCQ